MAKQTKKLWLKLLWLTVAEIASCVGWSFDNMAGDMTMTDDKASADRPYLLLRDLSAPTRTLLPLYPTAGVP